MRLLIISIVAIVSASIGVVPRDPVEPNIDTIERVDAFVEAEMRDAGIPGVALAIVEGDHARHLRGFGVADSTGRPVTAQTPFPIASMSKTFTGLAVMQLVEDGKISLDAPVRTYVPWFDVGHDPASGAITVRDLLTQRSGIAGRDVAPYNDDDRSPAALEKNVKSFAIREQLVASPGAEFHYNNANFDALGYVIEVVSGQSYEAYLKNRIFEPLDMERTYASLAEARDRGLAAGYYRWWGVPLETDMLPAGRSSVPSAGLASSAEDLSHWLIAHLSGGRYRDRAVLSPGGIAQIHHPTGTDFQQYGLGWFVTPSWDAATLRADGSAFEVPTFVEAGGIHPAYHGSLELFPDRDLAFAILMNTYDATARSRYENVDRGVRSILLGKAPEPAALEDPLLRYLKAITGALVTLEVAAASWSILRWRAGSRARTSLMPAAAILALSLAVALVYIPANVHSFLIDVALTRASDISITAGALFAAPLFWAVSIVLLARRRALRPR